LKNFSKQDWATAIAILFHSIGLIGILGFNSDFIIRSTPLNLLLMFSLVIYTQEKKNIAFIIFIAACFITGMAVELIGTSTGWLFGEYSYGTSLGPGIKKVPFIIGVNWFIIMYCCGIAMNTLLSRLVEKLSEQTGQSSGKIKLLSVVIDGATLAVFFDWIMEPAAVKLGYWQWLGNGEIPLYNYICWFVVSMALLFIFHKLSFNKRNKFAVNLLLIQAMFFLLLRTFL
jgi:putative membrane protein